MEYISHRINTISELIETPIEFGVEIDLRDFNNRLILQHDPFIDGEDFEEYLKYYNHGTMILNIKSERIEHRVLETIEKFNVKEYFFLDSSFPMIYQFSNENQKNIALRFSEFESIETILNMSGKVDWVWVDCFTKLPMTQETYQILKKEGFKICLVSPELQGQKDKINTYKNYLSDVGIKLDAVCSKRENFNIWKNS
ncbi:hypothetical protein N9O22_03720 [Gammaproteobacteria bacterium]|nr:hypothetical protein [Gammaproteobacteria bacterium]